MTNRSLFLVSLVIAAAGGFANIVTVMRVAQPHERTPATYLVAVSAFIGLVIAAATVSGHRPASIAVLGGATLASGLAFFWWTNPFGGWGGISLLLLIPLQWCCCGFGFLARWLWRATPPGP